MTGVMTSQMVPLAEAAVKLRLTREQLIRRVQRGELPGGQSCGRWYVEREALEAIREKAGNR